ncbi:hypothetical protein [Micromonospora sp. KC721]|uniref:hypothetical protein n=1 Tax=Micromonospora sp. KC721 TaxID=2530380 RepID=UPI00104CE2EE|nr:hypothetical protein [Micromonospora sp. KC721]TDB80938.1 hypothetical protein E1182_06985 [Micromonospora sp. KC721]
MEITKRQIEDVAAAYGLEVGADGSDVWNLAAALVEADQRFIEAREALRVHRIATALTPGLLHEAQTTVPSATGTAAAAHGAVGAAFDDAVYAVFAARGALAAAGKARRAAAAVALGESHIC